MDPAVLRRTQESLGKIIRKPPLTDKLLNKPPFRYLQDILTEVIRTTGFLKGLYTESELKSDHVKDKDAKIIFLQKAIDVIVLVTGEPLAVKPARIVAGHEPEKTNELLQVIGKCCLNKLSSEDAVRRVLSGEKPDIRGKPSSIKSQDKENRDAKEESKSHKVKEDGRESEIRERSGSREGKDRQQLKEDERKHTKRQRERIKESERDLAGDKERDRQRAERNDKERSRVRESRSETEKDQIKEKSKDRQNEGSRGKDREKDRTREGGKERDQNREREKRKAHGREEEPSKDREEEKPCELQRVERKSKGSEDSSSRKASEVSLKESKAAVSDKELGSSTKVARPSASKLRERRPARPGGEGRTEVTRKAVTAESASKDKVAAVLDWRGQKRLHVRRPGEDARARGPERIVTLAKERPGRNACAPHLGDAASDEDRATVQLITSENGDVSHDPSHAAQRQIPRPGSARPAPPRVKHQESVEAPVPERVNSGKGVSSVIVDKPKEEDDEEFVVEEAVPQLPDMPEMELEPELSLPADEKHGGLVKKILETKKDYETFLDAAGRKENLLLSDVGRKKEKDLVTIEIEKLRVSIQTLCRNALPLGKIMDYIQEDMDTMQNELQAWRGENRQHAEVLLREQSVTDTAVEPLKAELLELEQLIREQKDKICTVKGNILRNEEKIQKMVQSINVSSRA